MVKWEKEAWQSGVIYNVARTEDDAVKQLIVEAGKNNHWKKVKMIKLTDQCRTLRGWTLPVEVEES